MFHAFSISVSLNRVGQVLKDRRAPREWQAPRAPPATRVTPELQERLVDPDPTELRDSSDCLDPTARL